MNSYFTMASDDFVIGAICLVKSLRRFTQLPINVINLNLSDDNKKMLERCGASIYDVKELNSIYAKKQPWHTNPNFANNCFNKIHIWNSGYSKAIYLDSDVLVIKNIDFLFNLDYDFAACPSFLMSFDSKTKQLQFADWTSKYFNAGVLFIKPNRDVFFDLIRNKDILFNKDDLSDQGFLNEYFKNKWHKLEPIFNATRRVFKSFPDKWNKIRNDICVIHYTLEKPWNQKVEGCEEIENLWWECYKS